MKSRLVALALSFLAACVGIEPAEDAASLGSRGKGRADVSDTGGRKLDRGKGHGKGGSRDDDGSGGASEALRLALEPGAAFFTGDEQRGTDVLSAVGGGVAPFQCNLYRGPGGGTVPLGVRQDLDADPSGCTFSGAMFGAPGNYGFFVRVFDATGAGVDVPVMYLGPACDTPEVTMVPAPADVVVGPPGAAHTFQIDVSDVDAVAENGVCDSCLTTSVLTRSPLQTAPRLDCNEPGEVCSDGDITMHGSCPGLGAATATRFVAVDAHAPVRGDQPGWVTVDMTVTYSGAQLSPCGGKQWACHVEVLEIP